MEVDVHNIPLLTAALLLIFAADKEQVLPVTRIIAVILVFLSGLIYALERLQ